MALVTWTCGHKSRIIGTEKGKAKYMVCRDCYDKAAEPEEVEADSTELRERANAAADMSEVQNY